MAEYYDGAPNRRNSGRNGRKKGGRSWWPLIADTIAALLTLVLSCAIVLIIAMQYIDPSRMWVLPTLTLCAPIIYVLEIAAALYWIIRWKWRFAAFTAIFVAAGAVYVPHFYKIVLTRRYDTKYVERNFTKVVSYNVAIDNKPGMIEYIGAMHPDILCMQEFLTEKESKWVALGEDYRSTVTGEENYTCEIFTRHPILRHGVIDSVPRYNAVWADLKIGADTVRVIDLHMQSTTLHNEDTQFIQHHEYIFDDERESKLKSIVMRPTESNCKRAVQAEAVRRFMDESPYVLIVCGDFNDVPLSYTYHRIAEEMTDTFVEAGDGYSYTFDGYFRLLQIDHILVSPEIEVISYEADNSAPWSDHYPVITRLKLNKEGKQ